MSVKVVIYRYHASPKVAPIKKTYYFPEQKIEAWAEVNYIKKDQPYWGIFVKNVPIETSKCLHPGNLSKERVELIVYNLKNNLE